MLSIDTNMLLHALNEDSPRPLPANEAVQAIQAYRTHPRWRLIGFPAESRPLHDALWHKARAPVFAFGLGFKKLWNPIANP